jgi:hypothetical protein
MVEANAMGLQKWQKAPHRKVRSKPSNRNPFFIHYGPSAWKTRQGRPETKNRKIKHTLAGSNETGQKA